MMPLVLEEHYLFEAEYDHVEIVIHLLPIVHSLVETHDSSVIAQLWLPKMLLPLLYILSCASLIDYGFHKESGNARVVRSESLLKEVVGENVAVVKDLYLNSLKCQKLSFEHVLQYHETDFVSAIMSQCQKYFAVVVMHYA